MFHVYLVYCLHETVMQIIGYELDTKMNIDYFRPAPLVKIIEFLRTECIGF